MSHFVVFVFHRDDQYVDELLAPYNENLCVKPYIAYTVADAIAESRKSVEDYKNGRYKEYISDPDTYMKKYNFKDDSCHIKYMRDEFPEKLKWSDDEHYQHFIEDFDKDDIDKDGNIWSSYNPDSKWDWYSEGGWGDFLESKNGGFTDEDYVSEVKFTKDAVPFAFIDSKGVWHERGTMGWFACVSNEKESKTWEDEFFNYVENLDDDMMVSVINCHI